MKITKEMFDFIDSRKLQNKNDPVETNKIYSISLRISDGEFSEGIDQVSRGHCATLTSTAQCNQVCNSVNGCM